ncbi:hypothetical protein ROHU_006839 [Labeo rohita]|uniref:Uncharacterized protein n=1 Tax=Labeo rohita TaxID=84645 RepID=A0A498MLI0_LABRO|nr:hypothetical protein ROHU_006839 [Labeo rohita]
MRQCGNTEEAPAGADTAAAVGEYRRGSCGSRYCCGRVEILRKLVPCRHCCGNVEVEKRLLLERHYCGSVEIQKRLLREQILLRQCGNTEEAPAGADTAAAVWKYRRGFCGSRYCCGRVEILRRLLWERTLLRQGGNTEKACAL